MVLGLIILWRAGLVPFGQALFYAVGAYCVALLARYAGLHDVFAMILTAAVSAGLVAWVLGFLLARYRDIFFAMLSLATSMILYGVLVKTEALGSTDGFHVEAGTFLGYRPAGEMRNLALFWFVLGTCAVAAFLVGLYLRTLAGALAVPVRDNEIRAEFLGISVNRLIHLKLVISGILAGSLNFIIGYAGIYSLAHAAFFGIAAYTGALIALHVSTSLLIAIPVAMAVCALLSLVISLPSLRVRGEYFVVASLGLQMLAVCYWLIDIRRIRAWSRPFAIFGMNAIVAATTISSPPIVGVPRFARWRCGNTSRMC